MIFRLPDDALVFPDPALAEPDGLLAIGGDLSAGRLLLAYENGIFPWFSAGDPVCWYAPHERCVLFPDKVKVSRSMDKVLRSGVFEITWNKAFPQVVAGCAGIARKDGAGTWITDDMQQAYTVLYELGHAGSVEVWLEGQLAGGLYGVLMGRVFCGESMFSRASNASKAALIWLCRTGWFRLIDCQLPNDHLMSLGAEMIGSREFLAVLKT